MGDHPRTRGVYYLIIVGEDSLAGSSPHARGLLRINISKLNIHRIIPARAGFTRRLAAHSPGLWDHPRTRGVYMAMGEGVF